MELVGTDWKIIFFNHKLSVLAATGKLAGPTIQELANMLKDKFPNVTVRIKVIRNDFFGELITVSGLITGQDLMKQVKEDLHEDCVCIPSNMLRMGEDVFLDDYTLDEVQTAIGVPIRVTPSGGEGLLRAFTQEKWKNETR